MIDFPISNKRCLTGFTTPTTPSPRSASKKLISPLRCLSLKKIEEPDDATEQLQQPENDPYQDIETAYVAQICLTWEALHCQYTQLSQKISCQPENPNCYNHSAQQFQQFQVLLQRYIENEPFEQGQRAEIYARTRKILPKLLQVPNIKGKILANKPIRILNHFYVLIFLWPWLWLIISLTNLCSFGTERDTGRRIIFNGSCP